MELPVKSIHDMEKKKLLFDPLRFFSEDWVGTALDVLQSNVIPHEYKMRIVLMGGWLSDKVLRTLACDYASRVVDSIHDPDQDALRHIATANAFIHGEISEDKMREERHRKYVGVDDGYKFVAYMTIAEDAASAARHACGYCDKLPLSRQSMSRDMLLQCSKNIVNSFACQSIEREWQVRRLKNIINVFYGESSHKIYVSFDLMVIGRCMSYVTGTLRNDIPMNDCTWCIGRFFDGCCVDFSESRDMLPLDRYIMDLPTGLHRVYVPMVFNGLGTDGTRYYRISGDIMSDVLYVPYVMGYCKDIEY